MFSFWAIKAAPLSHITLWASIYSQQTTRQIKSKSSPFAISFERGFHIRLLMVYNINESMYKILFKVEFERIRQCSELGHWVLFLINIKAVQKFLLSSKKQNFISFMFGADCLTNRLCLCSVWVHIEIISTWYAQFSTYVCDLLPYLHKENINLNLISRISLVLKFIQARLCVY